MHTIDSLQGVFNPCPSSDEDDEEEVPSFGGHQHQEQQEDQEQQGDQEVSDMDGDLSPRGAVQRTREWARRSILETAGLMQASPAGAGGAGGAGADASSSRRKRPREDAGFDPPGSTTSTSSTDDEGEGGADDGRSSDGSSSDDDHDPDRGRDPSSLQDGGSSQNGGPPRCFLCDYCTSQEVRFVTTFISDNIANMDVGLMAEQIRRYIFDKRPEYKEGRHGLEVNTIRKHIREHMLSPTVRIADMMRHLLRLCDTLRGNLERVDPDTGESTADRSNIDTYLKVVTKVLDMYKMSETNKMLFANAEK